MRKPGFLIPCLFALAVLTGCNKDTADKYVGEQITSMKEKAPTASLRFWRRALPKVTRHTLCNFRKN